MNDVWVTVYPVWGATINLGGSMSHFGLVWRLSQWLNDQAPLCLENTMPKLDLDQLSTPPCGCVVCKCMSAYVRGGCVSDITTFFPQSCVSISTYLHKLARKQWQLVEYKICSTFSTQQQPHQVIVHSAVWILQTVVTFDVTLCGPALCMHNGCFTEYALAISRACLWESVADSCLWMYMNERGSSVGYQRQGE